MGSFRIIIVRIVNDKEQIRMLLKVGTIGKVMRGFVGGSMSRFWREKFVHLSRIRKEHIKISKGRV